MIIDARNFNQNINSCKLPTFNQAEAQKISRLLNKIDWKIPPAQDEEMAPLDGGASRAGRTDTLDLSVQGLKNIKEFKPEWTSAYERDYTKEDAVQTAWFNSQGTMFKLMGSGAKISDTAVQGMEKEDFADYMKTHELDREINWSSVEINLRGSASYGNFGKYSEYAAALCASLEDRIMTDFSGDEQAAQLEKLNEAYEKSVNSVIKGFKSDTSAFEILGVPLPEGKLENSIRAVMDGKRAAYRDYIKNNVDYANIKNTDDKWLARDEGFMANALRNAYKPSGNSADHRLWGEDELIAVGMMGTLAANEALNKDRPALFERTDEESVGLSISMCWLKKERIVSDYAIDRSTKELFDNLFSKYAETVVDRADKANAQRARDPSEFYASASPKLDIGAVNDVLRVMQSSWSESGNAKGAIQDAAKFAHDAHIRKVKMPFIWGTYSLHGSSNKYWENFYGSDEKSTAQSGMAGVLKSWNSFESIMDRRDPAAFRKELGGVVLHELGSGR